VGTLVGVNVIVAVVEVAMVELVMVVDCDVVGFMSVDGSVVSLKTTHEMKDSCAAGVECRASGIQLLQHRNFSLPGADAHQKSG